MTNEGAGPFRPLFRWALRIAVVASMIFLTYIIVTAFIKLRSPHNATLALVGEKEQR
jgi:hypothetical protein